jgi:phospholipase C
MSRFASVISFGALCIGVAACGGRGMSLMPGAPPAVHPASEPTPGRYIKHVIIVVQENRSFDDLFATYPGADGTTKGELHNGEYIQLKARDLYQKLVLNNSHLAFDVDYDHGKMNGFDLVWVNNHPCTCAYQYVKPSLIKPYWKIAQQYVLADHMFPTQSSGSFTAHQDLIRGGAEINSYESLIDFPTGEPWGCDAPPGTTTTLLTDTGKYLRGDGPYPCLTYETLRDLLDAKHVTWKYYTPDIQVHGGNVWDAFDAIKAVRYGSEWKTNISSPETNIFKDIDAKALPAVSWVIPDGKNSDLPSVFWWNVAKDTGPSWIAQIVNAIGKSSYWESSAIVITWDDWGGWYDHVAPPQLDYTGLGFRVPMLVVSPYAKTGYVSHTQYEFGSILKFVEDTFWLGRLGTTDIRATSIGDVFDFKKKARAFSVIPAEYSKSFFEHQRPSNAPVDTN